MHVLVIHLDTHTLPEGEGNAENINKTKNRTHKDK